MKPILCCAILILPAAHGSPLKISGNSTVAAPPKARVVSVPPKRAKILVSTSGAARVDAGKAAQEEKNLVPKVVAVRPVASNSWRWFPKFQKSGREDTTWGFIIKRPF